MIQACEEFNRVINCVYGIYLDSTLGFSRLREWLINNQLTISKMTGLQVENLDKKQFIYGEGAPADPKHFELLPSIQGELKKRNDKDGHNSKIIANLCIVLIYQYWEDYYREQIAKELGFSDKNVLKSDIMGDLKHVRHSIIHNNAIAIKKVEKCKLLKRFKEGDKIYVDSEMFKNIIFNIRDYIKSIQTNSNCRYWRLCQRSCVKGLL